MDFSCSGTDSGAGGSVSMASEGLASSPEVTFSGSEASAGFSVSSMSLSLGSSGFSATTSAAGGGASEDS